MIRFRMDIAGEAQLDRGIARFADGVSDYRPIWPVIADDFYAEEKKQFETEGAEGGEKWQALSPEYAAWKEARYPGKPILQRTGDLVKSLTSRTDPNTIYVEAQKQLTLGTKVGHAIYHQSPKPRHVLPRRPPLMFTEVFKRGVMRHIQTYLVEMANKLGFRTGLAPTASSRLARFFGKGIPPRGTSPRRTQDGTVLF